MVETIVQLNVDGAIANVALNDPDHRNALGIAMFDALDEALGAIKANDDVHVVLIHGRGKVFCAGFDLAAAVEDASLMGTFIQRLSVLIRSLRRLPQVVVAAVHGAAIAGGCALVSACDLVVVSATAKLGYPVHRIGVSPAVTIPTLQQAIGPGAARTLLMSDELIDASTAYRIGLASRLSRDDKSVLDDAMTLCETIARHGPHALRTTKAWLNELDGSLDDERFERPAESSAQIATLDEAHMMLDAYWQGRPRA
ncbi:MAG: enoyl-CoA hydratase/isomerase family protein [Planctomycetes bacterium]|nr:enoyl-CoA hydratase/isomerase family protein [Planctomycetota bacterium]